MNKKEIINKKEENILLDVMLLLYIILMHINYMLPKTLFEGSSFQLVLKFFTVGVVNFVGILFFVLFVIKYKNIKAVVFAVVMLALGLISHYFAKNSSLIGYISAIRFMGVALYLLYEKQNLRIIKATMITSLILFLPIIFVRIGGNIFFKASRNYYSVVLLLVSFVYVIAYWNKNRKAPLYPLLIAWIIIIFARGRGGRIVYPIFLIGVILQNIRILKESNLVNKEFTLLNYMRKHIKEYVIMIVILALGFSFITYKKYEATKPIEIVEGDNKDNADDNSLAAQLQKIEQEAIRFGESKDLKSQARVNIINKYFENMVKNPKNLLFGVNKDAEKIFQRYNGNLHNSYLGLHATYGLFGFLIMFVLGLTTFIKMIKDKRYPELLIFIAVLMRVAVDTAALFGHLDVIILYYIFSYFLPKESKGMITDGKENR